MGRKTKFDPVARIKWCNHCEKWLSFDEFSDCKSTTSGKEAYCRSCHSEYNEKFRVYNPHYAREYLYGLSEAEYRALGEKQDWCCALCGKRKKLSVDHNHVTSKVRGLLCQQCNVMLGRFKDDPMAFQRIIDYLNAEFALLV